MALATETASPESVEKRLLGLSEDEEALRSAVRDFCLAEIAPRSRELEKAKRLPAEMFRALGEHGILGVVVPEEYGGAGMGMLEMSWIVEEVARVDGGVALSVAASNSLATTQILHFGSEELKRRFLPGLASGELIGSWGLTEPGAGSDASALKTKARKVEGGWRLDGRKSLITHASFCDVAVVLVSTNAEKRGRGVTAFVVEKGMEGFSCGKTEDKLGCCASDTGDLVFQDCFVPDANVCGEVDKGYSNALAILEGGRVGIGAMALGLAQGALDESVKYAKERETFGQPLANHQAIQFKLADMQTKIHAARLMIQRAAALKDSGRPAKIEASMAKMFASEIAVAACEEAVQIHGGYGYTRDFVVEKHWRDSKLCTIGEGSSEVQRMVIARHVLENA